MSRSFPEISVCVITFNHEQFIAEAINSILAQKIDVPYEIVISDDKSADRTRSLCQDLADQHPGLITLLPEKENLGITGNFYRALSSCRGRYIAICEGDDYWIDDGKLAMQFSFLEENAGYGLVYTDVEIKNSTTEVLSRPFYYAGDVFDRLLQGNFINTLTVFFRKDLLELSSVSTEQLRYAFDHFYWLRIAAAARIFYVAEKSGCYRIHGKNFCLTGRVTSKDERLKLYSGFILDSIHFFLERNKEKQMITVRKKVLLRKYFSSLISAGISMKEFRYMLLMSKIICRHGRQSDF
jgi:glycosyltransferase involved in cell wall biosynthesis